MFKSKNDWMGEYNKLLESKGETSIIGCMVIDKASREVINYTDNHTKTDGLSCLIEGLKEHGFVIPEYPSIKFSKKLSIFEKILLTLRFLARELLPAKKNQWKYNSPQTLKTLGPYTHYFDLETTQLLKKKIKKPGVVLPAALLFAIDKAISEKLLVKKNINRWYIPFNMRGLYEGPTPRSNHISNFILELGEEDTLPSIYRKTLAELKTGSFLINFFFLNLGNYKIFSNLLKDKVEGDYKKPAASERMIGSCTYLGEWPPKDQMERWQTKILLPYGNVSLKNPISFTSILWNGQLAFSLQVHASIVKSNEEGQAVLNKTVENLNELLS